MKAEVEKLREVVAEMNKAARIALGEEKKGGGGRAGGDIHPTIPACRRRIRYCRSPSLRATGPQHKLRITPSAALFLLYCLIRCGDCLNSTMNNRIHKEMSGFKQGQNKQYK
ncbi:hypothetical protein HJC23_003350 [Cyclotella cryptica]|uniref:Uncharacterized protein n=1 Tax=Cyclotella cryptica TaxID=29204 RepID=A0ABD3QXU9_9STRA